MASFILETLTPIHIGDGESYSALNFLTRNNTLYLIAATGLTRMLGASQREKLFQQLENGKSPDLDNFLNRDLQSPHLKNKAIRESLYTYSIPFEGAKPSRVYSVIKSSNKVYIPGTEIKGAFRTALLYTLVWKHYWGYLNKKLQNLKQKSSQKQLDEEIQAQIFRPFSSQANYDLLRLLQISDSELKPATEVLTVVPVIPVRLTKQIRETSNYHEVITPKQKFRFNLQIADDKFKPDFLNKFFALPQRHDLMTNVSSVLQCAHEFYDAVLDEEISYYSRPGDQKHKEVLDSLREIKKQNTQQTPSLRLGKHQGLLSLTLALAISKKSGDAYKDYMNIIRRVYPRINISDFPKTRKVVKIGGKHLPLGWVKLTLST